MTATIIGGGGVNLALDPTQAALAQAALAAAAAGYASGNVLHSLGDAPTAGDFNVYNIYNLSSGQTNTLNPGGQAFALLGVNKETVIGHTGQEVLIGNAGNDTINAAGGSGTIITGVGANVVDLNNAGMAGGSVTIDTGSGSDTVNMWGGAATVSAEAGGSLLVNVLAGANTVTGNAKIALSPGANLVASGNDTISFGSGADTVVEVGTATVTAGVGTVTVSAGSGANSVAAGAGASTLLGGSGADTFTGGAGSSSMVGGSASNVFNGATGHDTMVGALAASSNIFSFNSASAGGTHTIDNFVTGQDTLKLVGYSTATALADASVVGGNTVIHFADNTTITLVGYNHLTASDISH
jgi:Ca2+-binding RTX toxin-like protein